MYTDKKPQLILNISQQQCSDILKGKLKPGTLVEIIPSDKLELYKVFIKRFTYTP